MTIKPMAPTMPGNGMMRRATGFSLIELVIVIVILGILAVTALPRFLDVTDEAKKASVEGVSGGFATGVSLVRAQWEAEGRAKQDSLNTVLYVSHGYRGGWQSRCGSGQSDGRAVSQDLGGVIAKPAQGYGQLQ